MPNFDVIGMMCSYSLGLVTGIWVAHTIPRDIAVKERLAHLKALDDFEDEMSMSY
jgi:hypothetical protein